jgi:hypothetical protein
VLAGDEIAAGLGNVAEALMALIETGVEVTPGTFGEGWGLALKAVSLDVPA